MDSSYFHSDDKRVASRVGATIVFYFPEPDCVERANRLAAMDVTVVVVDNTPFAISVDGSLTAALDPRIELISNQANLGIARALNQGIDALAVKQCDWVFLFDQDSEPSDELLVALPRLAVEYVKEDPRVALIGPAYDDPRLGGVAPFVRFRAFSLERVPVTGDVPLDVDFLISSGSCLNMQCWRAIGPMDEPLFIDFVDLEWCIRARRKGFRVLGIPWLTMQHSLGGEPLVFLGRRYPSHSAVRHYYLFRNAITLCLRRDIPWTWKSTELLKLPVRFVLYGVFFRPRFLHLHMALKGVFDGIRGKLGPLPPK